MYNLMLMLVSNKIQKNMNILVFGIVQFHHPEFKNVHSIKNSRVLAVTVI